MSKIGAMQFSSALELLSDNRTKTFVMWDPNLIVHDMFIISEAVLGKTKQRQKAIRTYWEAFGYTVPREGGC
jgi:hypothetical protein